MRFYLRYFSRKFCTGTLCISRGSGAGICDGGVSCFLGDAAAFDQQPGTCGPFWQAYSIPAGNGCKRNVLADVTCLRDCGDYNSVFQSGKNPGMEKQRTDLQNISFLLFYQRRHDCIYGAYGVDHGIFLCGYDYTPIKRKPEHAWHVRVLCYRFR